MYFLHLCNQVQITCMPSFFSSLSQHCHIHLSVEINSSTFFSFAFIWQLGEFRQATEDRHTHLYQNPWYVFFFKWCITDITFAHHSLLNWKCHNFLIPCFIIPQQLINNIISDFNWWVPFLLPWNLCRYAGPNDEQPDEAGQGVYWKCWWPSL